MSLGRISASVHLIIITILVPTSAKHIATQILVIAKLGPMTPEGWEGHAFHIPPTLHIHTLFCVAKRKKRKQREKSKGCFKLETIKRLSVANIF